METKHTPGPWMTTPIKTPKRDVIQLNAENTGNYIAEVHHNITIPRSEAEANARLIAAAPDTLKHGQGLALQVERLLSFARAGEVPDLATRRAVVDDLALALNHFAKAEGRA